MTCKIKVIDERERQKSSRFPSYSGEHKEDVLEGEISNVEYSSDSRWLYILLNTGFTIIIENPKELQTRLVAEKI